MKIINWALLPISVVALALSLMAYGAKTSIVYIKNGDVLEKYNGLKEANAIYEKMLAESQAKVDTIIAEHQAKIADFEEKMGPMPKAEKKRQEMALIDEAERIKNYQASIDQEMAKEHEKLLTGVLNQINAYAEIFAKKNGYDLVIGTTNSGNLMYGDDGLDITKEFIKSLNQYHKTGK